jgi:cysteine desulfurase/selenocysteine lyase
VSELAQLRKACERPIVDIDDFSILDERDHLHYLDSAATTQKPRAVLQAMQSYYEQHNANPHRGAYELSAQATEAYERSRKRVVRFLGVADSDTLIFTRGTTESLNVLASAWGRANVKTGDRIVVTRMEHHANFVPWQQLALAVGAEFVIAELAPGGVLDLTHLAQCCTPNTKVVAFGQVSNALGTINPVVEIVRIARTTGALVVCDGAQGAPHFDSAVDALGVDAYAFSGHKMLGPMGIGGLVVRRDILQAMPPYQFGGDMIAMVADDRSTWNVLPHKFEAGTPNVAGAVGLAAAVQYLDVLGMERVRAHEAALLAYATARLAEVPGLTVLGPPPEQRSGVVSFVMDEVHPHDIAQVLDGAKVCVRSGHHCAQPLMRGLKVPATTRASFYVYNDAEDVDALVTALLSVRSRMGLS